MRSLIHALEKALGQLDGAVSRPVEINRKYASVMDSVKQIEQDEEIAAEILGRHNQQAAEAQKAVEDAKWELTQARRAIVDELRARGLCDPAAQQAYQAISTDFRFPTAASVNGILRLVERLSLSETESATRERLRDARTDALAHDTQELSRRLRERLNSGEHNLKSAVGAINGPTVKTLAKIRDGKPTQLAKRRQVAKFLTDNPPKS